MIHPEDIMAGLREAGLRRAQAERDRAEAMLDITSWAVKAQDAGLSIADVARIAGVTRPTVYALIKQVG